MAPIRRSPLHLVLLLALAAVAWACGGQRAAQPETPPTEAAGDETASPPPAVATPAAVDAQLAWVLHKLEPGATVETSEYAARFSQGFRDAVPHTAFADLTAKFAASGPWQPACVVKRTDDETQLYLEPAQDSANPLLLSLAVDASADPVVMRGLRLAPAGFFVSDEALTTRLPDWASLDTELAGLAAQVSILAAEVTDTGELAVVHARMPDAPMAVGSAYKLWVLAALAEDVAAGRRSWDDTLSVVDGLRSLSSLRLDKVDTGTELTLREWAQPMIEVSDNTAADRLLLELGRERVEDTMRRLGHASPERNEPMLTTRDMFWLKLQATEAQRQTFFEGDAATRRALLESDSALDLGKAYWGAMSWTSPRDIHTIEWFASANDLAKTMVYLGELAAAEPEPLDAILSTNPGLPMCQPWRHAWFKGGSEGGVYNSTWMLERDDDRRFVLAVTLNDPDTLIPDAKVVELLFAATRLLGAAP